MAHFLSGSLCAVSNLSITSKTADEDVSHCVSFDCHGNVTSEVPSHLGQGQIFLHQYIKCLKFLNTFLSLF